MNGIPCNDSNKNSILFYRNGISFKAKSGEMSAVTEEMTAPWNDITLPTLQSNSKLENVFNVDEFGLPYQCLPTKTYLPEEKCSGGKNSKAQLSVIWEKLPMFVVGKSKTPRCFKNIKQLPYRYRSRKKSWMTDIDAGIKVE